MRVRTDVVSGFHHGLRPPLWLGRQAWTSPPNCLPASATDGGRISRLWPLPRTPITPSHHGPNLDQCRPISPASCAFKIFALHRTMKDNVVFGGALTLQPRRCPSSPHGDTHVRLWTIRRTLDTNGRLLSLAPDFFLVNSLAATIFRSSPGVRLSSCSDFRLSNQLYADDLVILQESAADLEAALDAVSHWGQQWRFVALLLRHYHRSEFGPPVMFSLAKCTSKATFCLSSLPIATSEWSSLPHFADAIMLILVDRGRRLFAQCVSWVRSGACQSLLALPPLNVCPKRFFRYRIRGRMPP